MVKLLSKNKYWIVAAVFVAVVLLSVTVSAQSAPENTKPGSSLSQRVKQRKAERKVKLDENATSRLQSSCVGAQTRIRQIRDEYVNIFDHRSEVYRQVDAKLWVAIGNLKYINKDTFKLEQERTEFVRQVKGFEAASNQFRQGLDDMSTMNCAADVVGFKAMVETARLYNKQLATRADGIRDHFINKIKPILSNHASELRPRSSEQ